MVKKLSQSKSADKSRKDVKHCVKNMPFLARTNDDEEPYPLPRCMREQAAGVDLVRSEAHEGTS